MDVYSCISLKTWISAGCNPSYYLFSCVIQHLSKFHFPSIPAADTQTSPSYHKNESHIYCEWVKNKCYFLPAKLKSTCWKVNLQKVFKKTRRMKGKSSQQYITICPLTEVAVTHTALLCWLISRDRHWWIKLNCFLCSCVTPFYLQNNLV